MIVNYQIEPRNEPRGEGNGWHDCSVANATLFVVCRTNNPGVGLEVFDTLEDASRAFPGAVVRMFNENKPKQRKRIRPVCTCADEDFCFVHPTDTDCLDPNGPWGAP